jgi:monovalent cation/proton antiporter MnhG/PhaG subunit
MIPAGLYLCLIQGQAVQRMHPPALAFSFSAWCVTLASILYFSAQDHKLSLHAWLIIIFLSITVPVTTILLARSKRAKCIQNGLNQRGGLAGMPARMPSSRCSWIGLTR